MNDGMPMTDRWTTAEMLELAARALGRIDRDGVRAVTLLSIDEIEAMAEALLLFGLHPIPPGAPAPDRLYHPI